MAHKIEDCPGNDLGDACNECALRAERDRLRIERDELRTELDALKTKLESVKPARRRA